MGRQRWRRPHHRQARCEFQGHERAGEGGHAQVSRRLLFLPAADLQSLPQPGLRRCLPLGCGLQTGRGRRRPDRPEQVPQLALLHLGVSLQKALLQLGQRQDGEMYPLLSQDRIGPAARLLPLLRRQDPLLWGAALRHGSGGGGRLGRRQGSGGGACSADLRFGSIGASSRCKCSILAFLSPSPSCLR